MSDAELRAEYVRALREHGGTLYGIARKTCGEANAADVLQEAFLRVWNIPDRFRRGAREHAPVPLHHHQRHRDRSRPPPHGTDEPRPAPPGAGADDIEHVDFAHRLIGSETRARVQEALQRLHTGERHAIMLAYFGDMTYREVAVRLGIAEGTVQSRIRAGLSRLRHDLGTDPPLIV